MSAPTYYRAADWGPHEVEMMKKFHLQRQDAQFYFFNVIKPRLDRAYKLYIAYNGDRAIKIKAWQSNIAIPYIQSVVETLMPRILDARPDFGVIGRTEEDQERSFKVQQLCDYSWEKADGDSVSEELVRATLIYGLGFLQAGWKKDVRKHKFLVGGDMANGDFEWKEKTQTFYDAPVMEWVDNYNLWYDWHNIRREQKQFWFKRLILTGFEVKRRYPMADPIRLELALNSLSGDLVDYGSIRHQVRLAHYPINKGSDWRQSSGTISYGLNNVGSIYMNWVDPDLRMHEVFEWWRPFDDEYGVVCNWVPVLKNGFIPMPYDFKEVPFIDIPYLRGPNEFEGWGIPLILENPQEMLNLIKNQRLDSVTMSIHKMWIVSPLANINKQELVVRPFGIIYSPDPNGVREVQFSDVKESAFREETLLKEDMRHASGVDDFSMGTGGDAGSATEVRHLRESTLERVRLFINHLGKGYGTLLRFWISMYKQFYSKELTIRITGADGQVTYPVIEKDDLLGEYDFKATVIPSIAGQNDVDKKQSMDLFQLLVNMPFVDPKKLVRKILGFWKWDINTVVKDEEQIQAEQDQAQQQAMQEAAMQGGVPVGPDGQPMGAPQDQGLTPPLPLGGTPIGVAKNVAAELGAPNARFAGEPMFSTQSGFPQAASPIQLGGGVPPTVAGPQQPMGQPKALLPRNIRGMNRTGRLNPNSSNRDHNSSVESSLLKRVYSPQIKRQK